MPTNLSQQITKINEIFIKDYLEQLHSSRPQDVEKLKKIFAFQNSGSKSSEEFERFIAKEILQLNQEKITLDNLTEDFCSTMAHFAKINDVFRRIRVIANQQYFDATNAKLMAASPEYVLQQLALSKMQETTPEQAQQLLNKVRISTITTSHPTNPTSVEYTAAAMKLAEEMQKFSSEQNNEESLLASIKKVAETAMIGEKKSQQQEVAEGMLYLESIYNSVGLVYDDFNKTIQENEKYFALKIPEKLFDFSVWITGDGDGNPNSTEETLRYNFAEFRKKIVELYLQDLTDSRLQNVDLQEIKEFLSHSPQENSRAKAQEFIQKLSDKIVEQDLKEGNAEAVKALQEIFIKAQNFGLHFATVDIRHESNDIMKAVTGLLKQVGAINHTNYKELTAEQLSGFFKDENVIRKIKELDYKNIAPYEGGKDAATNNKLTQRIFGRLKAVAENPDMSEKFIIAEFQGETNIQAAFLLLKASGNEVQNEKARISIVPLAEEKDNLLKLNEDISQALKNPSYLKHIKQTKKIYFMIAKSDTVRRGGVGAQESQEDAVRESIKSIIETLIDQEISDLENYEIIPYNGGGHALQRGGGAITELPSVYGRYYLRAIEELEEKHKKIIQDVNKGDNDLQPQSKKDMLTKKHQKILGNIKKIKINSPYFTVQGHQNYILFNPSQEVGQGSLRALASQAFYAEARLAGKVPDNEVENTTANSYEAGQKRLKAQEDKHFVCEKAGEYYQQLTKEFYPENEVGPINQLFENACWVSVKTGNKSSRASVRGVAEGGESAVKISAIKGENNTLLDQRAIGAEKLCAHSGTNLISWFGWGKALQDLKNTQSASSLNQMHQASKSMRDYMRSAAISLYMTDFSTSWQMMVGKERPALDKMKELAAKYEIKMAGKSYISISNEETMSYIELEAEKTKQLVYETITGKQVKAGDNFNLLEKYPQVKEEIDNRKKDCQFAKVMQNIVTNLINQNPEADFTKNLSSTITSSYAAVDTVVNTPIGAASSLTKARDNIAEVEVALFKAFISREKSQPLAVAIETSPLPNTAEASAARLQQLTRESEEL